MRKSSGGVKDALQRRIAYSFGDHYYFRKELKILNLLTGYIFLLDKFGIIRWRGFGLAKRTQLDMQGCRQWVKSRMEDRGAKPCDFSQTAPPHKPCDSVSNATFPGSLRNPQTVSFLKLLDLPYVLDNALDSRDTPASLPQKEGMFYDFERTGISTLVTMGVRDIQGEGFPDQFSGLADSVFLDLPQPWLAIPSG
ncbi:hypothetical protein ES332_A02G000400v1 [Gossypium tomentosum]|uniref:tRNA (adenine(58)-N(1))-methyltransferase catalytic subunit TRM61 C-terminal domain-containing protein n=1 Tax=Gossypium tomentosum TaxID=34277 RepID=A0A5D2RD64_GOSTO|nr:hypothetical protein ES332_A02G000400v1 [Gossypium tomentosum]